MPGFPLSNAALYVVAAIGVAAVGVVGWRAMSGAEAPKAQAPLASTASAPISPTPPQPTTAAPAPAPAAQTAALAPQPPAIAAAAPTKIQQPEFDVVRVEPSGDAVVAGRALAQSLVAVFNGDKKVGETIADANGQFVVIPSTLPPGDHLLTLRASGPQGETNSDQSVAVSVASKPGESHVAALTSPDKPTVVLSAPPPQTLPGAAAPTIAIRTVEAGEEGAFFASGVSPAGATVRLYLNNSFIAAVQAANNGAWGLKVERGMAPGYYDVRADMVDAANGNVLARAAVPFDYPAPPRPGAVPLPPPRPSFGAATAPAIVTVPPIQAERPPAPVPAPVAIAATPQPTIAPAAPAVVAAPAGAAAPRAPVVASPPPPSANHGSVAAAAPARATTSAVQTGNAPAVVVAAAPPPTNAGQTGVAVVPEIHAVTVVRGDNLWRISRRILGRGARYTQIYEANAKQIRDPNRIWPGQIFVAPQAN